MERRRSGREREVYREGRGGGGQLAVGQERERVREERVLEGEGRRKVKGSATRRGVEILGLFFGCCELKATPLNCFLFSLIPF